MRLPEGNIRVAYIQCIGFPINIAGIRFRLSPSTSCSLDISIMNPLLANCRHSVNSLNYYGFIFNGSPKQTKKLLL